MLIAPTEPAALKALGKSSSVPERFGADVLFPTPHGLTGIQRKEFNDLLASLDDGRLVKELAQLTRTHLAILIVEGRPRFTLDGDLIDPYRRFTRHQYRNLLLSVQAKGVMVEQTDDLADTMARVIEIQRWSTKSRHTSLERRPKPSSTWGHADHEAWACHLLQSFDGLGPVQAKAMVDQFGGPPLAWTVTEEELRSVPGVGKVRAHRMVSALDRKGVPTPVSSASVKGNGPPAGVGAAKATRKVS